MKFCVPALPTFKLKPFALGRFPSALMLCAGLMGLQGCASSSQFIQAAPSIPMDEVSKEKAMDEILKEDEVKHNVIADHLLTAEQMFLLLRAEMQLKRGLGKEAFDTYYQLADETREPELARRAFAVAMATYQPENIAQAASLWRSIEPDEPVVWRASFVLSLRSGDVDSALQQWQTYADLSVDPLDKDILTAAQRLGSAMIGNVDASTEFMQRIAERYPDQWSSQLGLGTVLMARQELPKALEAFQKALTFDGLEQKGSIYDLIAKLYLQMEKYQEGVAQFSQYVDEDPENISLQEKLARLEVQAGMVQQAEQRYQSIIDKNPQQHSARFALALLKLENNQNQQAKALLETLLQVPAYQDIATYYMGYVLQNMQQLDEALEYFQKVYSPAYLTDSLLHQAEIYFTQGDLAKAFEALDSVDTSNVASLKKVLLAKAIFYRYEKQYSQAVDVLQELLEVEPDNQRALLEQGNLYFQLERYDSYVANMQRLLELDADNVDALNGLGYYYAENHIQLDEAKKLITRALELDPDNYFILDSMGWVHYQLKEYAEAVDFLRKAFAVNEDEVVMEHLIRAYWMAGMRSDAEALWQRYREEQQLNQEFTTLQEWIEKVE
ncbi:tetratricopeptide repeat protein [Thiomicrorhabdus sp. 6S3-12]|uniref:tetratricopeptide repeat protein n=1 Tax=Thiomicrorhabdus sp. 6S3-12 TaxID=2819681 RepID=UPI001AAD010B|nr:tetratricopeptide repeat protein [Thiomicrorhabdus sp. 6S3-12]MBO1923150.1 tetratricopeptide repeat protein [Thiomicrorhabdus sp. 6S3-12]